MIIYICISLKNIVIHTRLSISGDDYIQESKLTINGAEEIKFSNSHPNIVQEGPLLISTDISGFPDVKAVCTLTPLNENSSSCGSYPNDTTCVFNITDTSQADLIAISVEVSGVLCSLMKQELLVTSKYKS